MNQIMNFTYPKEALEWATIIAKSKFCPKEFFNHPESVLVAIAYGAELGLKPLQALQNICVINGKPSIYGDAMLAVCKNSPDFEYITESCIELSATCKVKRKNQPEVFVVFNKQNAMEAGLWGKPGPWKQYPNRMLQMRARSFALRDCFPDVLKGMIATEEAQDYPAVKEIINLDAAIEVDANKELEQHIDVNALFNKIMRLTQEKNISQETIDRWLAKAGVDFIIQLPAGHMQKIIEYLEKLEVDNGV